MIDEHHPMRFYSRNLCFVVFPSGLGFWRRKDFRALTKNDEDEARAVLDLLMEEVLGNA